MTPSPLSLPEGCSFRPRCPRADDACREPPLLDEKRPGRFARCFHPYVETATAEV